jgi:uncharacterized protein YacL
MNEKYVIVLMVLLGFVLGFVLRKILTYKKAKVCGIQNISKYERVFRFIGAVLLFLISFKIPGQPIILIIVGFILYEVLFSWCGYKALWRK